MSSEAILISAMIFHICLATMQSKNKMVHMLFLGAKYEVFKFMWICFVKVVPSHAFVVC